ncbi:MAG: Rpp14/Pop5 family protein [archaeon]|nr:Rpp14/Pop5 family protein [archaeon]
MNNIKMRVKALPSSQRGKKRYVLFELLADKPLSAAIVQKEVEKKFAELFGSRGMALQKLHFIGFYGQKNLGVLKCSLETCEEVKAGLLFVKSIAGFPIIPRIVSVSGSVKKLKGLVKE